MRLCSTKLRSVGFATFILGTTGSANAVEDHLFVVTSDFGGTTGSSASIELLPPWSSQTDVEPVGGFATVRTFEGRHYVVNPSPVDDVQVIDPATFDTILRIPTGAGSNPRDILWIGPDKAYVTRLDHTSLLIVNPTTGAEMGAIDLSAFADADGSPEMSMMARDGDRAFIQLQRVDRASEHALSPSYLAVVDVTTDTLVDVDPDVPGTQAITLAGRRPSYKMQIDAGARRLYVSEPGEFHDGSGGIDEIDLDELRSLGFIATEASLFTLEISGFVLVSEEKGYVISHTDFAESSHLASFRRSDGVAIEEIHVTYSTVRHLAYDEPTNQLFFLDRGASGVHVFDTETDERLTAMPIATGLPPFDLAISRGSVISAPTSPATTLLPRVVPNPASSWVRISTSFDGTADVAIYDVRGRLVRRLSGRRSVQWDLLDNGGHRVAPGVYEIAIDGGERTRHERLVVR